MSQSGCGYEPTSAVGSSIAACIVGAREGRLQRLSTQPRIARGTPAFRRTTLALFAAGFATFALMYCVQPLLPELARAFGVSATSASLAVSLTTGALAIALLVGGSITERFPRKSLLVASLIATSFVTLASAAAPAWTAFLLARAAAGVAFAGLPAIAMAYVVEEMAPDAAGLAMGIYVAGTAVGGMSGRLFAALLTDVFGWRAAIAATGGLGLLAAFLVATWLPLATHWRPATLPPASLVRAYRTHLGDPQIRLLLAQGFLFMGVFIAVLNYLTFRLVAQPFALGHASIGLIFLVYLVGLVSSPWAGHAAELSGRRVTLAIAVSVMLGGVALTWSSSLVVIIAGLAVLSFGFFAAHAVTSAWVGRLARGHFTAQASSLYIVCYYAGASLTGTLAGAFWDRGGWTGVVALTLTQTLVALALLRRLEPN
jgi:MFS transporter, YNFM family, putative membrane transport protein